MAKIAKILPLPREHRHGESTLENALAQHGYAMFPGSGQAYPPMKGPNGRYLTGLDDKALYIQRMPDPAMREAEKIIVNARRERLELASGVTSDPNNRDRTGLGALSPYYSDIYDMDKMNTQEVAQRYKLTSCNVFNFNNAQDEITYWWLIQNTKLIAPSLQAWRSGTCPSKVLFYIDNPEAEANVLYVDNMAAVDAIVELRKMTIEKRLKVAKLLGLPVSESTMEQIVFNKLHDFIQSGNIKDGEYKGQKSVKLFNQICSLSDEVLARTSLVKEAINTRVYIKRNGIVYEGNNAIANSEELLIQELCQADRYMEYLALKAKVDAKQKMKSGVAGMEYTPSVIPSTLRAPAPEKVVTEGQEIVQTVETTKKERTEAQRKYDELRAERTRNKEVENKEELV